MDADAEGFIASKIAQQQGGDFRNRDAVRAWALDVADELAAKDVVSWTILGPIAREGEEERPLTKIMAACDAEHMTFNETSLTGPSPTDTDDTDDWACLLASAERACCCGARPKVVAVLPPTSPRPYSMDLLFCLHHYRMSEVALADRSATVYDEAGEVIAADVLPIAAA